jgi:hypothetical protein
MCHQRRMHFVRQHVSNRAFICFLALCAALPYGNTLLNSFVADDMPQVLQNPYVRSFGYLRKVFSTSVMSPGRPYRCFLLIKNSHGKTHRRSHWPLSNGVG